MSITTDFWKYNQVPFYQAIKPTIERLALLPPQFSIEDDDYLLLVASWDKSVNADSFTTLDKAVASFKGWVEAYEPELLPVLPEISLSFTVAGATYNVNLKYGQNTSPLAALHDAIRRRGLMEADLKTRYTDVGASVPAANSAPAASAPVGNIGNTQQIEITEIRVIMDERGNKRIRAAGGQYMKWGIPVYPEVLKDHPDWMLKNYGVYNVRCTALVQFSSDGKPQKVVGFNGLS